MTNNHESVPWNGLGIDYHQKSLSVQFEDQKTAKESTLLIKKLIGEDVPIVISVGQNYFEAGCPSRGGTHCSQQIGGLEIDDTVVGGICTLGFPVVRTVNGQSINGFITAGHCFPLSNTVLQPYGGTSNTIGTVTARDFVNNGDCDCEFITQTSSDARFNYVYAGSNSIYNIPYKSNAIVGQPVVISGAGSNVIDWGIVEGLNYSYSSAGITITGTTRVSSWVTVGGDSGAPVFNPTAGITTFYGTHMGRIESGNFVDQRVYIPWSAISLNLNVS